MSDFSLKDVIGWVSRHLLLTNRKDTCDILTAGKASLEQAPNVSEGKEKAAGSLVLDLGWEKLHFKVAGLCNYTLTPASDMIWCT